MVFKPKTKFLDLYASLENLPFKENELLINTLKPFGKCFIKPIYSTYGYINYKDNTKFLKDLLVKSNIISGNDRLQTIYFINEKDYDKLDPYFKKAVIVGELQINEFRNVKINQFKIDKIIKV